TPPAPAAVLGGWIARTREGFCYAPIVGILACSGVTQSLVTCSYRHSVFYALLHIFMFMIQPFIVRSNVATPHIMSLCLFEMPTIIVPVQVNHVAFYSKVW